MMYIVIHIPLQDGRRAIDIARAAGHMEVVQLLLQAEAQLLPSTKVKQQQYP